MFDMNDPAIHQIEADYQQYLRNLEQQKKLTKELKMRQHDNHFHLFILRLWFTLVKLWNS